MAAANAACSAPILLDTEVFRYAHALLSEASEMRQPVGLALGGVRSVVVDGHEDTVDEHAVPLKVIICPGHELPADLDAGLESPPAGPALRGG